MKQVEFLVNNQKLKGTLISPQIIKGKHPAVLFIHGWTSVKERSYQYANGLAKLGYISLLFDMRGHGESEGDINTLTTEDFLNDDMVAYDYLSKIENIDKENISLVGSSMGGYLAALLTSRRKFKNLILRAPADYPPEMFHDPKMSGVSDNPNVMQWRKQPRRYNESQALYALHDFGGNILLIESEKDDRIPHETIQNYVNAVKDKGKLTFIVMKDAPHSIKEGPFRDEVERILVAWFKEKL